MKRAACALLAWASLAGVVYAAPAASCLAERAGDRAQVRVVLTELFDRELLHLVRLGLRGQIHVELALYRRRALWFDDRRDAETREAVVVWSPAARAFTLDGQALASPGALALPSLTMRLGDDGAHYVEVNARLEVVTVRSLGQMTSWLVRGEGQNQGDDRSALARSLLSYVAADLARTVAARCDVR
jgi:hypothetical protein